MSVISNNILAGASGQGGAGAGGYEISRSLRFYSGDSSSLTRTPSAAGSRTTYTLAFWIKRTKISADYRAIISNTDSNYTQGLYCSFLSSDVLLFGDYDSGWNWSIQTNAVFRDTSAWYHIVCVYDSTNGTEADRAVIYVNGVRQDVSAPGGYPTPNEQSLFNTTAEIAIGRLGSNTGTTFLLDGYLADVHFIDGQALAPTDFGETNTDNLWVPKAYAGTYGPLVDTSQTWSSGMKTTTAATSTYSTTGRTSSFPDSLVATAPFDADLTNFLYSQTGGPTTWFYVEFGTALANVTSIVFSTEYSCPNGVIKLNGTDVAVDKSGLEGGYVEVTVTGTIPTSLTEIAVQGNIGSARLKYLKIDGKYLIDSGVTVPNNGFHLDFADNSSNAALGYDAAGSNNWTVNNLIAVSNDLEISASEVTNHNSVSNYLNVFDGDITTTTSGSDNAYITWTPATNISVSKFEAYFDNSLPSYQIEIAVAGGSTQTITIDSTEGWEEFTSLSGDTIGPNNAVTFNTLRPNGTNCGLHDVNAIRINDKIVTTVSSAQNIDSLVDTPTNGTASSGGDAGGVTVGNYATWNPLVQSSSTFSNGNLQVTTSGGSGYPLDMANFYTPAGTGKWYWEFELDALSGSNYTLVGMLPGDSGYQQGASDTPQAHGGISVYVGYDGSVTAASGAATAGTATATFAVGDILGWAFDAENGTLQCYKNGVSQGTQFTNIRTNIGWVFCVTDYDNSATATYVINFGQRAFAYAAPSGYKSLNTANLPEPTIADGSKYFDTKLWTGNATSRDIAGFNMSPDMVWIKKRNSTSFSNHSLFDTVRGATKALNPNDSNSENNETTQLTAFNSDGFTLGTSPTTNGNNDTFVSWNWDAESSNTTIAAGTSVTNQAQTWSSNITTTGNSGSWYPSYPATYIFDSTTTNYGHANGDGSVGCVVTLSFSPAVTCNANVSLYGGMSGSGTAEISINGGTAVALTSGSSATTKTTVFFSGTISSIVVTKTSTGGEGLLIYGFEIDGNRLLDNTAFTSPGFPSIASTVRANPSAGFSIVKFTSADGTVGHGLSAAPHAIIAKRTDASYTWSTFWHDLGNQYYIALNSSNAASTYTNIWGSAMPTSSVFSFNTANVPSGGEVIAYCFAPVEGYSAMGSYTGNGSADGPFVYTGFKVAWVLIRPVSGGNWAILDTARDPDNGAGNFLLPNDAGAEFDFSSSYPNDILSNGFKVRNAGGQTNTNGQEHVYLAFASNPFASNGGLAR